MFVNVMLSPQYHKRCHSVSSQKQWWKKLFTS